MIEREKVLGILSNIIEPELKKDIISLNLVEDLIIEDNEIHLTEISQRLNQVLANSDYEWSSKFTSKN